MVQLLDCTLRDGGYYTKWDFDPDFVKNYIVAMDAARVDYVELGLRSFEKRGFKGAYAYTTEEFLSTIYLPDTLHYSVMVNAAELLSHPHGPVQALCELFPPADESKVSMVRVACHDYELQSVLPASAWIKDHGYKVAYNVMQIAGKDRGDVEGCARLVSDWPIDVLYFADSLGSMTPDDVRETVGALRTHWSGEIGVHAHDSMGRALVNSLGAVREGATWVDGAVTGMGRGPGNAKTEALIIELEGRRNKQPILTPLARAVNRDFRPLQHEHGWGHNLFYHLSGKYSIHPTYIQEMLSDRRYNAEDTLAAIEHLRQLGNSRQFDRHQMEAARNFYAAPARGEWTPRQIIEGRDILVLGNGPGVAAHRPAIEALVNRERPVVVALNTESGIAPELIDYRAACHPLRLIADCDLHAELPQTLITPLSMLPEPLKERLLKKEDICDFGMQVVPGQYSFGDTSVVTPSSLVIAYVLAICASGRAKRILMAGFDGYPGDDRRNVEIENLLTLYSTKSSRPPLCAITKTRHSIPTTSVYALNV